MTPAWTILSAFAGAFLVLLLPARLSRMVALVASLVGAVAAAVACLARLSHPAGPVWDFDRAWIPELGIRFHLAANGLSLTLILLTGIVAVAGVLFSWNVSHRPRAFFAFFLTIIGGVYGVFLSRDAFLLFVCYEIVILPKYLLIAIWGSSNREFGAMKLTLYSIGSSALILVGLVVAYAAAGSTGFDLDHLAGAHYPASLQAWAFPLLFLGFAVLAGIWPFHTWAPTGHVAAPTAASMLLAGVVMKLGAYGALCVAMPLFPQGFEQWKFVIAGLAVIGIIYGALTALAQKDLKFVIAYSSVSHMGLVLLGLATGTHWGLRGAVLQMISHGIIAGLLFGIAGRVVYERTHTRSLSELRTFDLWRSLPGAAVAFTLATAASMGVPGFSGFVAEISVVIGLWQSYPWLIVAVAAGII
ncbi:MAG: NADH-quinone oxidoreductase subunit M, partial [Luteolibacter sp.]